MKYSGSAVQINRLRAGIMQFELMRPEDDMTGRYVICCIGTRAEVGRGGALLFSGRERESIICCCLQPGCVSM